MSPSSPEFSAQNPTCASAPPCTRSDLGFAAWDKTARPLLVPLSTIIHSFLCPDVDPSIQGSGDSKGRVGWGGRLIPYWSVSSPSHIMLARRFRLALRYEPSSPRQISSVPILGHLLAGNINVLFHLVEKSASAVSARLLRSRCCTVVLVFVALARLSELSSTVSPFPASRALHLNFDAISKRMPEVYLKLILFTV